MQIEGITKTFGELTLYFSYADQMMQGKKPYIDIPAEYPIGALYLFKLADIFGEKYFTLMWYGMVALATLGIALIIKKLKGNPYIFLAAILPLEGLFYDRFDIFPALFSIIAVYAAIKKKNIISIVALTIGILLKIYPIILLPVLIFIMVKNSGWGKMFLSMIIFGTIMLTIFFTQQPMIQRIVGYHGHRGIEIESVKAIPLLIKKDSIVEFKHSTYEIRENEK